MLEKLFRYIVGLRRRSEPARRRIAALAAAGLTLVIVFFWLLNLKYGGLSLPLPPARPAVATPAAARPGVGEAGGVWDRVKAGWRVLLERFNN